MIQSNFKKYTLEADVDDYVKVVLSALGLKKGVDYNEKSAMSDYMKEALKGAAKTKSKKLFGIPDFHLESRKIPVVIENKLGNKYHISANKSGIKMDENSIKNYAVNGAVYYAKNMDAGKIILISAVPMVSLEHVHLCLMMVYAENPLGRGKSSMQN